VIRAWVADAAGAREVTPAEAVRVGASGPGVAWVDLDGETEAAAREVLEPLGIHPLVLTDMVLETNRPKVDNYGGYLYLVVHSARWDEAEAPALRELDIVVGERFLITYHDGGTRSITSAQETLARRAALLAEGPARLLYFVLDVLVDNYLPIMDRLAEGIDRLEDEVFEDGDQAVHQRIVRLKRGMLALRRIVGPQRDTILALTRDEFHAIPSEMRPYLRDVYDRLARVSDLLDTFRDEVATLLELHVSIVSNQLNTIIKRLTVIATVGLPLTVVTSYYGMNFSLAEYRWRHAPLYVLGLLGLTAGLTWWYLRRRRWL
jgi:magnesium transporter